jgi:uncharacterized protein
MLLTVEMLRHYQRCSRRAFLDVYGDPIRQDFQNDFRAKLQQDRYALQQTILAGRLIINQIFLTEIGTQVQMPLGIDATRR